MDSSILKNVHLFSDLNEDDLDKIYSRCDIRTYNKGEIIFFDTEPYQGFYIVVEGGVKIFKISKDGREHILYFIYPFNIFAEVPLLEQYEKIINDEFSYPANSMAMTDNTKLILIRSSVFYNFVEKNGKVCLKMLSSLAKKLRHLNNHIETITQDVPKRLAKYILSEHNKNPIKQNSSIELTISKHDLASYLGTIDETLSRVLKKFQDEKLIVVKGKKILIKDKQALVKISSI
ncbi:MAG: Crp/Fnr family transcriptional regulator [Ignavibacteria bacterium]|jgi:CRP-like cAMP-binding protein|nr:Crp/Fnr family transcriptional regulator [Ignavibacteria bacterium]